MTDPALFALAVLALLSTPGPTNTLLATAGALQGARALLPLMLAELAGYLLAIAALHLLLRDLLFAAPFLSGLLRVAVGLYLVKAAVDLWRGPSASARSTGLVTPQRVFATTAMNPKAMIFTFSILPLAEPSAWAYLLAFSTMVLIAGGGWIVAGATLRSHLGHDANGIVPRVSAIALVGFAGLVVTG